MLKTFTGLFMSKEKLFEMMTYQIKSNKDISEVVSKVELACEKHKFALLHSYIYHEVVASKGFPIDRKVYIYEICQAKVAAEVLTHEPDFAPFMPCRLAIYEADGNIILSTQNMQMIIDTLKDNTSLFTQTNELFITLKSLMNDIK